jgi:hypothetical protein
VKDKYRGKPNAGAEREEGYWDIGYLILGIR